MFFTCLVFTLSYRPGSQNVKADTLSQLYDTEERSMAPTPILPVSCLVASIVSELDADIERASRAEPTPPKCPAGRLYVPSAVRDLLIYWAHMTSWGRSDGALSWWEVLLAHFRKRCKGLCFLLLSVRPVQGS